MEKKNTKKILAVSLSLMASFAMSVPSLPNNVKAEEESDVVNPIAKYEFKDATNPGKDSMNNYNLELKDADGKSGGTVAVEDGVATFNGTAGLRAATNDNDISESLESFTLAFKIKTDATNSSWASPIGFGWNDWNPSKWATFQFAGGSDLLRFSSANSLVEGVSDIDGNQNAFWGKEIGSLGTEQFHQVILSVDLQGNIEVSLDGATKYSYKTPTGFTLQDSSMRFALGGESVWGNIYDAFTGSLKDVEIYDFAFTNLQKAQYNATGHVYRSLSLFVVSAEADLSETVIAPSDATNDEILLYAPASSMVEVTMSNDSKVEAQVKWNKVVEVEGNKVLEGDIQGLVNPDDVKAHATITLKDGVKDILPVAKYEFKDAANPGKDSMGNYDLTVVAKDADTEPVITVADGVATFNGTAGLVAENDVTDKLTSFTLSFNVKSDGTNGDWASPAGFGWDDWNATKWAMFEFSGGSTLLRYTTAGVKNENTGLSNVDGNGNQWWGKELSEVNVTRNVILVVDMEALKTTIYVDGSAKYEYALPADYSLQNDNMHFAIGCVGTWGNANNLFSGEVSNVSIYDFAVNGNQVKVLMGSNAVKSHTVSSAYIVSIADQIAFENNQVASTTLTSEMSEEAMLAAINNATVVATLSDDSTVNLPVTWESISVDGESYTLNGRVSTAHTGYLTVAQGIDVSKALTVEIVKEPEPEPQPSESTSVVEETSEEVSEEVSVEPVTSDEAKTSEAPVTPAKKKGCKGAMGGSIAMMIACLGLVTLKKKRAH